MKKFLSMILAVVLAFAAFACKKPDDSTNGDGNTVEVLDEMFLENGVTPYKIVVPAKDNSEEMLAADEFNVFFKEATGRSLEVITDEGLFYSEKDHYLSLGQNSLFKTSGIAVDNEKLSYSGYIIKTQGNTIFVTGSNSIYSDGTVNGVYEVLEHFVGYHYYAPEAYKLDHNVVNLNLLGFEIENVPDFEKRIIGFGMMRADQMYAERLRVLNYGEDPEGVQGVGGHFQYDLMNKYVKDPDKQDWFVPGSENYADFGLCYSNLEMRKCFAEELKTFIRKDPGTGRILHLGQPDTLGVCKCEACETGRRDKFMNNAGQQIDFVNWIADYLDPWLKENYPDKTYRFSIFAYHYSEQPPVVWNEEKQEYEPFSEYVIPRDNVGIYWAPINQDFSKPITDPTSINTDSKKALEGWNALLKNNTEKVYMWNYCLNMRNYFINYTSFPLNGLAENYKFFYENGVECLFEQGPSEATSSTATMEELRMYVHANLMWDTSLNINDLIHDFISFYYGEAGEVMQEYYDTLNAYFTELNAQDSSFFGGIFTEIGNRQYWPKGFVDHLDGLFQKAYQALDPIKESDPERYQMLYGRIEKMYATIDYLNLEHYMSYYKPAQVKEMIERFETISAKYNMYNYAEGQPVTVKINKWKSAL